MTMIDLQTKIPFGPFAGRALPFIKSSYLLGLVRNPPSDMQDALRVAIVGELRRREGGATTTTEVVLADGEVIDTAVGTPPASATPPEPWNQEAAATLVKPIITTGFHDDHAVRQRQFDAAFAIDTAWLAKDLTALRAAVASYPTPTPAPAATSAGRFAREKTPDDWHWRHYAELDD